VGRGIHEWSGRMQKVSHNSCTGEHLCVQGSARYCLPALCWFFWLVCTNGVCGVRQGLTRASAVISDYGVQAAASVRRGAAGEPFGWHGTRHWTIPHQPYHITSIMLFEISPLLQADMSSPVAGCVVGTGW
jgi:hypothetical protein